MVRLPRALVHRVTYRLQTAYSPADILWLDRLLTSVAAACGIGTRVLSAVSLPAIVVVRGVETMSGRNVGVEEAASTITDNGACGRPPRAHSSSSSPVPAT